MREGLGRFTRALGAAGMLAASGMEHGITPAQASEGPKITEQSQVDKIDKAFTERSAELTRWVADFGVPGLRVQRESVKTPIETISVYVGERRIFYGMHPGDMTNMRYTPEELRKTVAEALTEHGIFFRAPTQEHPSALPEVTLNQYEIPLAKDVSYEDTAETVRIMKRWGIDYDGYAISMKLMEGGKLRAQETNQSIQFSHEGERTIVIRCTEENNKVTTYRITDGILEQ